MIQNDILFRNYKAEMNTFIGKLHEKDIFDYRCYCEYYNQIKCMVEKDNTKLQLDRETTYIIFFTYNYFLKRAFWNASQSDLSKIKGITDKKLSKYIEQLSLLIEEYIVGKF